MVPSLHGFLRHDAAPTRRKIASDGLLNAAQWSDALDAWQAPYVNDESKPLWYRGALFNELYILADGGSVWGRPVGSDSKTPESFAFLECFDYPFYGTLDVRFYGSMPLVKFWPELDKQVSAPVRRYRAAELTEKSIWIWKTQQTGKLVLSREEDRKVRCRTIWEFRRKIHSCR